MSKVNTLTRLLKKIDSLPHPRVASAGPPLLETTHLQNCTYMQHVLCNVVERELCNYNADFRVLTAAVSVYV
jgi:hypothetical protein